MLLYKKVPCFEFRVEFAVDSSTQIKWQSRNKWRIDGTLYSKTLSSLALDENHINGSLLQPNHKPLKRFRVSIQQLAQAEAWAE